MRQKKMITATPGGTPAHMVVYKQEYGTSRWKRELLLRALDVKKNIQKKQ
jgi:hypothetical protein